MAVETSDGGGRRHSLAAGAAVGWQKPAKNRENRGNRGGRTGDGGRCWTPAGATVEAAGFGGVAGWQQKPGAGDRRRREEAKTEEADGEGKGGGSRVWEQKQGNEEICLGLFLIWFLLT